MPPVEVEPEPTLEAGEGARPRTGVDGGEAMKVDEKILVSEADGDAMKVDEKVAKTAVDGNEDLVMIDVPETIDRKVEGSLNVGVPTMSIANDAKLGDPLPVEPMAHPMVIVLENAAMGTVLPDLPVASPLPGPAANTPVVSHVATGDQMMVGSAIVSKEPSASIPAVVAPVVSSSITPNPDTVGQAIDPLPVNVVPVSTSTPTSAHEFVNTAAGHKTSSGPDVLDNTATRLEPMAVVENEVCMNLSSGQGTRFVCLHNTIAGFTSAHTSCYHATSGAAIINPFQLTGQQLFNKSIATACE